VSEARAERESAGEIPSEVEGSLREDWCERGDSNPHGFTRQILSLVRLPIPPLSQVGYNVDYTGSFAGCCDSGESLESATVLELYPPQHPASRRPKILMPVLNEVLLDKRQS
jgi:hypothetical protein